MFVQAIDTFRTKSRRLVRKGDVLDVNDPVVQGAKALFRPLVERATAAPGEVRRGPGRPRKDATI